VVGIPAAEEGPEERGWELLLLEKGAELKRVTHLFVASVQLCVVAMNHESEGPLLAIL